MKKILVFTTGLAFMILLVVAACPAILSTRHAKDWVIEAVNRRVPGTLSIDGWALGWLSGVHIEGLHFKDAHGQVDVRVPKLDSPRGLLYRILSIHDLGAVVLKDPEVILTRPPAQASPEPGQAPSGSGMEKRSEADASSPWRLPVLGHIQVVNATLQALLPDSRPLTVVRNVDIDLDITDTETPVRFAVMAASGEGRGKLTGKGSLRSIDFRDFVQAAGATGEISIGGWEISPVFAAIGTRRPVPEVKATLDGALRITDEKDSPGKLEADFTVTGFEASGGPLGTDHPKLDRLAVSVRGERADGVLDLKNVSFQSPVLNFQFGGKVTGTGDLQLEGGGGIDLAMAAVHFPRTLNLRQDLVIDKGALEIEGGFGREAGSRRFRANADIDALFGSVGGRRIAWRQPARLSLSGSGRQGAAIRLEDLLLSSAFVNARASGGLEDLKLEASVDIPGALAELGNLFPLENWKGEGRAELVAEIKSNDDNRHGVRGTLTGAGVTVKRDGRLLVPSHDPTLTFDGDLPALGNPSHAPGFQAVGVHLAMQTWLGGVTVGAERVSKDPAAASPTVRGLALSAEVDTRELSKLLSNLELLPAGAAFAGKTGVTMKGALPAGGADIVADVQIADFIYTAPGAVPVSEEKIGLSASVQKAPDETSWQMKRFALVSAPLSIDGSGSVYPVGPELETRAEGTFEIDLGKLSPYLKTLGLADVILSGKSREPFTFQSKTRGGEWDSSGAATIFSTALDIDRVEGFGLELERARLPLNLKSGVLSADLKGTVNQGTLDVAPRVHLDPKSGKVLFAPNSKILTNVHLTDAMAKGLLSRFHPLFSGAVSTEGLVGLEMASFDWPLFENPGEKTFSGRLWLENVRLEVSGFLRGLTQIFDLTGRYLEIGEQRIEFSCENGRVATSPLHVTIGRQPLTISGAMGLDRTIEYTIETPVTENLVGKEVFPLVEGTLLQIPLGGTVAHPEIDREKLDAAVSALLSQATGRQLEEKAIRVKDRLQRQADKLFEKIFK